MKNVKRIFLSSGLILAYLVGFCQTPYALKVGDIMPDLVLNDVLNHGGPIRLSSQKGKLIILDFGGLNCGPCIAGALFSDSLYHTKEFGQKLLPVWCMSQISWGKSQPYHQRRFIVANYLKSNINGKKMRLPIDWGDTVLFKYFPHKTYPFQVWIGKTGKIIAIASQEYLNIANLRKAINTEDINSSQKNDNFTNDKTLVRLNKEDLSTIKKLPALTTFTAFTGNLDGIESSFLLKWTTKPVYRDSTGAIHIRFINQSIADMYILTFGYPTSEFPYSHILIDNTSPNTPALGPTLENYIRLGNEDDRVAWQKRHSYCYELKLPGNLMEADVRHMVAQQLDAGLEIHGSMQKRPVYCWVVSDLAGGSKIIGEHGSDSSLQAKRFRLKDSGFGYRNLDQATAGYISLGALQYIADHAIKHVPMINESKKDKSVMLWVTPAMLTDLELLKKGLEKYGLTVSIQKRELEMLVFKNTSNAQ